MMSEYFIRPMELAELKDYYKHIEADFAADEYPPYAVLYQQLQGGIQEGIVFCKGERDLAYSICTVNPETDYVLISLFAVLQQYRGEGIGSAFIRVLREIYEHKKGILVEVERPEISKTVAESNLRRRRIKFYEDADFYLIPGIDFSIWDVPMHLMALPRVANKETINEEIGQIIYQIYFKLLGSRFIHMMKFYRISD